MKNKPFTIYKWRHAFSHGYQAWHYVLVDQDFLDQWGNIKNFLENASEFYNYSEHYHGIKYHKVQLTPNIACKLLNEELDFIKSKETELRTHRRKLKEIKNIIAQLPPSNGKVRCEIRERTDKLPKYYAVIIDKDGKILYQSKPSWSRRRVSESASKWCDKKNYIIESVKHIRAKKKAKEKTLDIAKRF